MRQKRLLNFMLRISKKKRKLMKNKQRPRLQNKKLPMLSSKRRKLSRALPDNLNTKIKLSNAQSSTMSPSNPLMNKNKMRHSKKILNLLKMLMLPMLMRTSSPRTTRNLSCPMRRLTKSSKSLHSCQKL